METSKEFLFEKLLSERFYEINFRNHVPEGIRNI